MKLGLTDGERDLLRVLGLGIDTLGQGAWLTIAELTTLSAQAESSTKHRMKSLTRVGYVEKREGFPARYRITNTGRKQIDGDQG